MEDSVVRWKGLELERNGLESSLCHLLVVSVVYLLSLGFAISEMGLIMHMK